MSETVMDILGEFNLPYYANGHGLTRMAEALAAARREVETLRAALEDVRRVEVWLRELQADDPRTVRYSCGEYEARDYDGEYIAGEQSLEALGRALGGDE